MATIGQARVVPDALSESPPAVIANPSLEAGVERYFEFSLFAMIVTGFVVLAGTGQLDPVSLMFVFSALGLRAYLLLTGRALVLSVPTTSRLTLGYVVFYALDFMFFSGSFVTATVHLVLFIMVVKMFAVQRDRDHVYLAIISFMMILASAILTVDSFFLGAFCLFLLLSVSTFVSMEMRLSMRRAREKVAASVDRNGSKTLSLKSEVIAASDTPASVKSALGFLQRSGGFRGMGKSLVGTAFALVVAILLAATAIFFIVPRLSTGYLTNLAGSNNFVSGFSDQVKLGAIGRIQQSDAIVMHVKFNPEDVVPADLKWKGVTLSHFDGTKWYNEPQQTNVIVKRVSPGGQLPLGYGEASLRIDGTEAVDLARKAAVRLNYHVVMQPIGTNAFFLTPMPVTLIADAREFTIDGAGTVGLNDPTRQITYYTGYSVALEPDAQLRRSDASDFPHSMTANYLQLPPGFDPRITQMSRDATKNAKSVYEKSIAIERYLKANYGYTLELLGPADQRTDALAHFLFVTKKGHCEYFASAMAVLLRAQGIPARIANGFRNGEFNDISGSYIVRARDAHSWVEAYIPGFGWASFDPTPAASGLNRTAWSRMLLYVDAMREFWSEWVINYDFAHQNTLGESAAVRSRTAYDVVRMGARRKYFALLNKARRAVEAVSRHPETYGMRGIVLAALVLLLVNFKRLWRHLQSQALARKPAKSPANAASIWYARMLALLSHKGVEKTASQTPEEFLKIIEDPGLRESVAKFTNHYERARFGGSAQDAVKLPEMYQEVEKHA